MLTIDLNREVWEGWTVQNFIDELSDEILMIMERGSWVDPFKTKAELAEYIAMAQPYIKTPIPEVVEYFALCYNLE